MKYSYLILVLLLFSNVESQTSSTPDDIINQISVLNISDDLSDSKSKATLQDSSLYSKATFEDKNILAIGYQIGGYSLVGFNYEIRVQDYFGIHFGAGFIGYTAGIKIHTSSRRNSPFFNICFKDGGFGQINVAGVEYGGKLKLSRTGNFGIHFQIGLVKILSISSEFERTLFRNTETPEALLSMGLGLSW